MKKESLKIQTGDVCPETGIWSIAEDGIGPTDEIKAGEIAPAMNGGIVTWWLLDD